MFKHFTLQWSLVVVCVGLCVWTQNADAANGLRSAYLGSSVWKEGLSSSEVNQQVKDHFAAALVQLEAKNASSLLTALTRAEASSAKPWSKDERRAALIYLAHNRQQQIKRIRDYMIRGRFPLNEGQSPDVVPVFVDRHNTRCAVAHLMHSDGKDFEVAEIVNTNNLVRAGNVQSGGIVQWIRTSGLTQEEVAMVQPAYPIEGFTFFNSIPNQGLQGSTFTLSDFSVRGVRFNAMLPPSFATDPSAIDAIFVQGLMELENSNVISQRFLDTRGVVSGPSGELINRPYFYPLNTPSNLDAWLYFGSSEPFGDPGLIGGASASGNVGIIEIEYQVRADEGTSFSRVAVTSEAFENQVDNETEQNALLFLSEIYRGNSNDLLGESQVLGVGSPMASNSMVSATDITSLSEDFLRIKTYGLVVGDGFIESIFNEFETTETREILKGDVDMNEVVDFEDIGPFIAILQAGTFQAEADCGCDGTVGFEDIAPFVAILQGQ